MRSDARTESPRDVSVKDVAAAAEVSLGTVSNVLNRPHQVSEGTRLRVEQAMSSLGFVRNESARQLRMGRSRMLAYVMSDITNPFFTDVAQAMDHAVTDEDLSVFLCTTGHQAAREAALLAQLQQQRVRGILLTPVDPDAPALLELARSTPVVLVDRTRTDRALCSVAVDDLAGGRLAVEHLVDRSHQRIAFVGGPMDVGQVRERHLGASQAWQEAGRAPEDLVLLRTEGLTFAAGREAGERLFGIPARRRPTAAFCANDLMALGLLQSATRSGRRVPDDLSIVGFDDIDFAAAAAVPLTSVRQPRSDLGATAARLVLAEASGAPHRHEQIQFAPELVERESTRR